MDRTESDRSSEMVERDSEVRFREARSLVVGERGVAPQWRGQGDKTSLETRKREIKALKGLVRELLAFDVRRFRLDMGLTQEDVAKLADVAVQTVVRWEQKKAELRLSSLDRLCDCLLQQTERSRGKTAVSRSPRQLIKATR